MEDLELLQMISQLDDESKKEIEKIIERFIIAHDPDYTKLTPREKRELDESSAETETTILEDIKKELGISKF